MTREIKFRAWDRDYAEYEVIDEDNSPLRFEEDEAQESATVGVLTSVRSFDSPEPRYIFEQYTGLKDKNGKEIYEGDIIKCGAMVGVATMFEDLACWCIGQNPIWSTLLIERDADGDLVLPTTFIIGNIHENPELLRP